MTLPPEIEYQSVQWRYDRFTFDIDLFTLHNEGSVAKIVENYVNRIMGIWRSVYPYFRFDGYSYLGIKYRIKNNFFITYSIER